MPSLIPELLVAPQCGIQALSKLIDPRVTSYAIILSGQMSDLPTGWYKSAVPDREGAKFSFQKDSTAFLSAPAKTGAPK